MPDITTNKSTNEIPYGYCACGCGEKTRIETHSHPERGQIAGQPRRYIAGHQNRKPQPQPGDLRVCTRCNEVKPLTEYSQRKSGTRAGAYYAYCRECASQVTMESRAKRPNYQEEQRAYMREWYAQNREQLRDRNREYYAANAERKRELMRNYRKRNPQRSAARNAVRRAVRRGEFPPAHTMVCECCQEVQAAHWHHHKGYSQEYKLDVIALCTECHGKVHWGDK